MSDYNHLKSQVDKLEVVVETALTGINQNIKEMKEIIIDKQENRLRDIEKTINILKGAIGVVMFIGFGNLVYIINSLGDKVWVPNLRQPKN